MDASEDDKAVTYRLDVPGLGPKDVDVEVFGAQPPLGEASAGTRNLEVLQHDVSPNALRRPAASMAKCRNVT